MYVLHTNRARIKDNHADEFLININWGTAHPRRSPADNSLSDAASPRKLMQDLLYSIHNKQNEYYTYEL